jgi:hypothetical protein
VLGGVGGDAWPQVLERLLSASARGAALANKNKRLRESKSALD